MKMDLLERVMIPERIRIPILGGKWYRHLTKKRREQIDALKIEELCLNKEPREFTITCTLTTFPDRIETVQHTIKSIFNQSMKPDRITLWLAEEEFRNRELPESIKKLQEHGLEVCYCENLFGHKRYYKLIPEQKSNELIVMFDDDILFPEYIVERLIDTWKRHPKCVVCDRGQIMEMRNGKIINPGRWSAIGKEGVKQPSYRILASPGGGCLVPYGAFHKDAVNPEIIKKYAIKTGDIWLMFMAVQNDTRIIRSHRYHRIFILSEDQQTVQLGRDAIYNGRYVQTFYDLANAYPHAFKNMIGESSDEKKH